MRESETRLLRWNADKAERINLRELPTVPYEKKTECLPRSAGIYFIFKNDLLVYIGEASSIWNRAGYFGHKTYRSLPSRANVRIGYFLEPDPYRRRTLEQVLISIHAPIYNRTRMSPERESVLSNLIRNRNKKPGPKANGAGRSKKKKR